MADVAGGPGPEGAAYWSGDLSDEDQPPVYVPGVSAERNFRAGLLLKAQKPELKAKVPVAATPLPMDALRNTDIPGQQVPDKGGVKSASLKDLCPEDKRRIANLIKELARVSEEKEVTEERLKAEQESFEKKIRQLEEQNELIIKEREGTRVSRASSGSDDSRDRKALQQQYRECQELLSLYQKYLSEQQEKLTHSLSELEAAKQKEQQMSNQRSLCQPLPPSELDGSYLSIAGPQTLYKNNRTACGSPHPRSLAQPCGISRVLGAAIPSSQPEDTNGFLSENGECNNVASPAKRKQPPHIKRTPDVDQRKNTCPLQTCFFHKKFGSSDHDSFRDGCYIPKRYSGPPCESSTEHSCPPWPLGLNGSTDSRSKETERGKRLTEGRRKQLLLQKMELEVEKERLQNLLAKQEAKLLLQQQQLHQSRLDYNRFKGRAPNSEELLIDEALMRAGGLAPVMNGGLRLLLALRAEGSDPKALLAELAMRSSMPDCEGCLSKTPASGKGCRTPGSIGGNSSGKKSVGFSAHGEDEVLWEHAKEEEAVRPRRGMTSGSRKDAATSPGLTGSRKELVATATSPIRHDTSRYEASLFDLVEAMSLGLQHHYGGNRSHSKVLVSQSGSRRKPGWNRSPSGAGDGMAELEESRILEEIFFI